MSNANEWKSSSGRLKQRASAFRAMEMAYAERLVVAKTGVNHEGSCLEEAGLTMEIIGELACMRLGDVQAESSVILLFQR